MTLPLYFRLLNYIAARALNASCKTFIFIEFDNERKKKPGVLNQRI